ncbi:MAG: hypothetical protein OMM_13832, partial [Candidatus Magnetoglobus multicellularis str. Araruama]
LFGFGEFIDLAPRLEHSIRLTPDFQKHIEGDILFAHTGNLALCKTGRNKMKELVKNINRLWCKCHTFTNGKNCGNNCKPKIVMPDLLGRYNHGLMASVPKQRSLHMDGLETLQKAMHKVVQHGTAKQVFSDYDGHQRVYGKTGTASMFENEKKREKTNTIPPGLLGGRNLKMTQMPLWRLRA